MSSDGDSKESEVDGFAQTVAPVDGPTTFPTGSARDRPSDARVSGEQIGRYTLRGKLGAGGMAVVYSAWDPQLSRQVAVKVLHGQLAERMGQRLVREAQSMAQLSHPNVVTVYEVSVENGEIFICMELVGGTNLREWLRSKPRSQRDIINTFVAAGRGLEAAHRARIIHRDFKPDNVLIDTDGRVRVTDFGLAREMNEQETSPERIEVTPQLSTTTLTASGDVMGTPLYMAAELLEGETADTRSDQYAYCVALYEALYGVTPYSGKTFAELVTKKVDSALDPVPGDRNVPRWLRALVLRGMHRDPAQRFETMSQLLRELERDRGALIRRGAAGALGVAVAALAAALWLRPAERKPSMCPNSDAVLASVWDRTHRDNVTRAFQQTKLPHAEASLRTTLGMLDTYATGWAAMSVEACNASQVRKEQTATLYETRSLCLEQRKTEMTAAVGLLEKADAQVVSRIDDVIGSLEPLAQCANATALLQITPPPTDPASASTLTHVEATLAEASLQLELGKYDRAYELVSQATSQSQSLNYSPLRARLEIVAGQIETKRGKFVEAERHLRSAIVAAERGRDDRRKVQAYTALQDLVGWELQDFKTAEGLEALGDAALERVGDDRELRAGLLESSAPIAYAAGNYELALDRARKGLELATQVYGPAHPTVAKMQNQVAVAMAAVGKFDEAIEHHRIALNQIAASYGDTHPDYAIVLNDLANTLAKAGKADEAEQSFRRSLTIMETSFGARHPQTATAMSNVASMLFARGEVAQAAAMFQDALSIENETLGPEHPALAITLVNLGAANAALGHLDSAEESFRRALRIRELQLPSQDPRITEVQVRLGTLLVDSNRITEARALLETAADRQKGQSTDVLASAEFALARALWGMAAERGRARLLAEDAVRIYTELKDDPASAMVTAWLGERHSTTK